MWLTEVLVVVGLGGACAVAGGAGAGAGVVGAAVAGVGAGVVGGGGRVSCCGRPLSLPNLLG